MSEIIFEVREDEVDGGYTASALGYGIHTQGDTVEELRAMVKDAVRCYFDETMEAPKIIRLHFAPDCDQRTCQGTTSVVPQVTAKAGGLLAPEATPLDPHNKSHNYPIKKLQGVAAGEGQYRLRSGRFRFRYDIAEREAVLLYCGLRREDTY
ncbi:MAG TPA: hypothetical protein VN776_08905 [Terracidiphilus sp.]|nr:hypothetical protein [Terracidiphilus sp.]